ncbi:hypothetical protein GCM10007049_32830 [Echinicola pacifica]|uniref:beta-N-acetylhexosaminidase n=1 Tax=Echinicola pacifica TaxID=346377 RepID=A0A918QAJ4_9BACT|nr:beta-N-acetylhexosaminidase [Echinicola pacifica]GGZ36893.1 hypothetical protein GCM10007049_32830 [Echinicola pacifica]
MRLRSIPLLIIGLLSFQLAHSQNSEPITVVPKPASIQTSTGKFLLSKSTAIVTQDEVGRKSASIFNDFLERIHGLRLPVTSIAPSQAHIELHTDVEATNTEAYRMDVTSENIEISGSEQGIFYGLQTLLQLIEPGSSLSVPAVSITDEPEFAYRGIMLDVARHFFEVDQIKNMIDLMAHYKFNKLHWHLTEDQGWRLEIKKYPKLTEIAAYRDSTIIGQYYDFKPFVFDGQKHGGYYTQEEAKEIVRYAAERMITVIPEIELPGHSSAALTAYPEFSSFDSKDYDPKLENVLQGNIPAKNEKGEAYDNDLNTTVPGIWGVHPNIYGVKEETFTFLEDILTEVMEIFPSHYIHIGGDEVPKDHWKTSELAQQVIKKEKLADEHELQSYFITRMEKFLNKNGRDLIGWDEILEGGLAPNATVMSWRGEKGGIQAAQMNHDVIMSPNSHMYIDHYQSEDTKDEPLAIGGFLSLEKVYSYHPRPSSLTKEQQKHILGVQGNLWTEYIATDNKMEYHLFPRALAIAEVGWTNNQDKDYEEFSTQRLPRRLSELEKLDVFYRIPEAKVSINQAPNSPKLSISIDALVEGSTVYYSVDGHKADQTANLYSGPFLAPYTTKEQGPLELRYIIITPEGRQSNEFSLPIQL